MDRPINVIHISGVGRCGTNLVANMLRRHPNAYGFPFETRFTVDPDGILDFYASYRGSWTPTVASRRLDRLEKLLERVTSLNKQNPYRDWELGTWIPAWKEANTELLKELKQKHFYATTKHRGKELTTISRYPSEISLEHTFRNYLLKLYGSILDVNEVDYFIDDNTWSILYLLELDSLLGYDHSMVHVIRHPLDVIASMREQKWCPCDPILCAKWYSSIMDRIRHNISRSNVLEVRYEDFLTDTERELQSICHYTGLECNEDILYTMNRGALYLEHINRWHRDLPEYCLDEVIQIVQPYLDYLEYGAYL